MDLSPEVLLVNTLKPGTVYLIEDELFSNGKPHFVVIINKIINIHEPLYLVVGTSKIEKRLEYVKKSKLPIETLVFSSSNECSFLTMDTVFNCNTVLERTIDEMLTKVELNNIITINSVPESVLERIRLGVTKSPLVTRKIRKSLL